MSKWSCEKCGACCEILYPMLFGRECSLYDKEKQLCRDYKNRPEICRAKHQFGEETTIKYCNFLRELRKSKGG